jgi:trk system potassium uptake protein
MNIPRQICGGFAAVILLGTVLLALPGASTQAWGWDHVVVALFTSTSAVCVTGHSVVDPGTYFTVWGQMAIVALVQVGGLGYMTVTTGLLLLLGKQFDLKDKVAVAAALDRPKMQGLKQVLKSIIATTLLLELTGTIVLWVAFMADRRLDFLFEGRFATPLARFGLAGFLSVSAWNNAGFSLMPDNLISYQGNWAVNGVIATLIILGGIGYEVLFEAYFRARSRASFARFSLNFKVAVSTTIALLGLGTLAFWTIESHNPQTIAPLAPIDQLLAAIFQSVTTRTAGFNTIDISKMSTAGLAITMALMFVGGSPGGTAGGIKTTTLRILMSCTRTILRGREVVVLYRRQIPMSLVLKAVGVLIGSMGCVALITTAIALLDPEIPFSHIAFDTISAFATVGLSTGMTTNPQLSVGSKLLLILAMYLGRVGVLLGMSALLGTVKPRLVSYPEENLLVG